MKKRLAVIALVCAFALLLRAAISIQGPLTRLTFDALPSSNDWRAASVGGDSGSGVVSTAAQLDALVQTLSVASITNVFATQTTTPPSSFNYARWNSAGQYLQSRMGNNWCGVFVATLRNDTPDVLRFAELSFDVTSGPPLTVEEVPGLRVYYSLTGESYSWVNIPFLSTSTTGRLSAVLDLEMAGLWSQSAEAYLLWADDNAIGTDAYYTLDNLALATTPRLSILPQPGGVELSWPEGWNLHRVQTKSDFAAPGWQTLTNIPAVSAGRLRVFAIPTNTAFFRLAMPGN